MSKFEIENYLKKYDTQKEKEEFLHMMLSNIDTILTSRLAENDRKELLEEKEYIESIL